MPTFAVTWTTEVDRNTPEEAALAARDMQVRPDTTATVFEVYRRTPGLTAAIDALFRNYGGFRIDVADTGAELAEVRCGTCGNRTYGAPGSSCDVSECFGRYEVVHVRCTTCGDETTMEHLGELCGRDLSEDSGLAPGTRMCPGSYDIFPLDLAVEDNCPECGEYESECVCGEPCPECGGKGWDIYNDNTESGYRGEVQRCDCGTLATEEEACAAARAAGVRVGASGKVLPGGVDPYALQEGC